tara:strand:- start:195 stop:368 length:174 start_codon:yes stop_codon:yes gene_type:complete
MSEYPRMRRPCRRCGEMFIPTSRANRICGACKYPTSSINLIAQSVKAQIEEYENRNN